MKQRDRHALDRHITGNYGEDFLMNDTPNEQRARDAHDDALRQVNSGIVSYWEARWRGCEDTLDRQSMAADYLNRQDDRYGLLSECITETDLAPKILEAVIQALKAGDEAQVGRLIVLAATDYIIDLIKYREGIED